MTICSILQVFHALLCPQGMGVSKDKKNAGKELRLILNKGYGKIFKDAVKNDERFILT